MTNKEFMQTLDTEAFEEAMHAIYFGGIIKKGSTPSANDVIAWLNEDFMKYQTFWTMVVNG